MMTGAAREQLFCPVDQGIRGCATYSVEKHAYRQPSFAL
jgi:hypothetical protein